MIEVQPLQAESSRTRQAVLAFGGTIDFFVNTVFNYPTLAECYKVAALDGFNKVGPLKPVATG